MNRKVETIKSQLKNYDLSSLYKNGNYIFETGISNDLDTLDEEYKKYKYGCTQMCELIYDLSYTLSSTNLNIKNDNILKGIDKMFKLVFEGLNSKVNSLKDIDDNNDRINSYQEMQDTHKKLFDLVISLCDYADSIQ